jgi:hypothetical protein
MIELKPIYDDAFYLRVLHCITICWDASGWIYFKVGNARCSFNGCSAIPWTYIRINYKTLLDI